MWMPITCKERLRQDLRSEQRTAQKGRSSEGGAKCRWRAQGARRCSGCHTESAVQGALFGAFEHGEVLSDERIVGEMRTTVPLLTTMREKIDALRAWAANRAKPASSQIPESASELREQQQRQNGGARRKVMPSITPGDAYGA